MARRSNAARTAKRLAREAAAELDKLTLTSRAGVVLARKLTAKDMEDVVEAQLVKAKAGSVQSAREVRAWLALGMDVKGADDGDGVVWADMTREQRATARANILANAEQRARDAEAAAEEHETA
jgi:hypothetical protein